MLAFASILLDWYARASADGKIDQAELAELLEKTVAQLGIDIEVDLPPALLPPAE